VDPPVKLNPNTKLCWLNASHPEFSAPPKFSEVSGDLSTRPADSIFDAMLDYYHQKRYNIHSTARTLTNDFILRIYSAEWLNTAHIIECELTRIDFAQENQTSNFDVLQSDLIRLHTWRRRCSKYSYLLQSIAETYSEGDPTSKPPHLSTTKPVIDDIQDLHNTFQRLTKQSEMQLTVLLGRISIEMGHQSVWEASYVTRITIAGLAFLPLSFVASIFSMGGQFAVDAKFGWVYFVVAIPLAFMVVGGGIYRPKVTGSRGIHLMLDASDSTLLIDKGWSY
jgi:Mg2+ and Co2+ transporter CorA